MSLPLPSEKSVPTDNATVRISVGGLLLFMLAANMLVMLALRSSTPNDGYAVIRKKWEVLQSQKEPVDILILGDSAISQGVDPEVLGKELGGSALNVATVADTTVIGDALMFDDYLTKHPMPKLIVMGHVYDVWPRRMSGTVLAETPLSLETLKDRLGWAGFDNQTGIDYLLGRYVPLYSQNKSLQTWLKRLAQGKKAPPSRATLIDDKGFMHWTQPDPKLVAADIKAHKKSIEGETPTISPTNRAALEHVLTLAQKANVPVIFTNSPINEELYRDPRFQAYYDQVGDQVQAILAKYPNAHYVMRTPMTFPSSVMQNVDHLIEPAAERYTEALARDIKATESNGSVPPTAPIQ